MKVKVMHTIIISKQLHTCLAQPLALASCQALHPDTLTHTLTPSDIKFEKLLSFQDIFTKIGGHLPLDLSHRLAKIKFKYFVCSFVSWFICSLKSGKVGYFATQSWKSCSVFKISLPNLVAIFLLTYLTNWKFLFMCLSVNSFVH